MVKTPLRIGLVGCGSRGLSIFERILSIAEQHRDQPVAIDIFDPNTPGTGVHWLDQPDYLLLNTVAGQLGVFPDAAALGQLPLARERRGPDFLTWCRKSNIRISPATGLLTSDGREVMPDDFLPRRLLGIYLADAFEQILAATPSHVTVKIHRENVTALETNGADAFVLHTASGTAVTIDQLVLTVGHTSRTATQAGNRIENIYPLPHSLKSIKSGEAVLIEGLGLGAMDVLAALTVGRGGQYERTNKGFHRYRPSDDEPVIFVRSRDGLPFKARPDGLTQLPRHKAVVLTSSRITSLRKTATNGQLDFDTDILPLMMIEMRSAAMGAMVGGANSGKRQDFLDHLRAEASDAEDGIATCLALLNKFEATLGSIDPQDLIRHTLPAHVKPHNYHAWIYDDIEADLQEAGRGLVSPIKAAAEVWRDLRDRLREVVDFEGLTQRSHQRFYEVWHKAINRLVAGPQKERHADLLALCNAGLLTFIHPEALPAATKYQRIAAFVQSSGVLNTECAPIRDLEHLGLIRPRNLKQGTDGIDVDPACHPRSRQGEPVPNIWVLGPLAEVSCYYNHYVASNGAPSRLFIDAHKAAIGILEAN